jgi:hypothetical protein
MMTTRYPEVIKLCRELQTEGRKRIDPIVGNALARSRLAFSMQHKRQKRHSSVFVRSVRDAKRFTEKEAVRAVLIPSVSPNAKDHIGGDAGTAPAKKELPTFDNLLQTRTANATSTSPTASIPDCSQSCTSATKSPECSAA